MCRVRRSVVLWLLLWLPALVLSGCTAAGRSPGPRQVSLVLDWYPNAAHAFIYAAQQQGYFAAEGLEVTIKMPAENPTDGIKLVGAGQETFALYYQPDVLLAHAGDQSIPIVAVASVVRHPLNAIMVRADSGIATPADLAGKVVGYSGIPLYEAVVRTAVRTAGGDPAAVRTQDVGWDLIPALATRRVDAISGGFINHEQLLLEQQGIPVRSFAPADFGVPDYSELVLITGTQTLQQDRGMAEAFWRALARGFAYVQQNPDRALDELIAQQSKEFPLDRAIEARSLALLLPLMDDGGRVRFGVQDPDSWQQVAGWLQAEGLVPSPPRIAEAFVDLAGGK